MVKRKATNPQHGIEEERLCPHRIPTFPKEEGGFLHTTWEEEEFLRPHGILTFLRAPKGSEISTPKWPPFFPTELVAVSQGISRIANDCLYIILYYYKERARFARSLLVRAWRCLNGMDDISYYYALYCTKGLDYTVLIVLVVTFNSCLLV